MEFTINADTRIQILDELTHLARARKHQYAAFVRDEGVLCVWSDNVKTIVADVEKLEKALLDFVWGHEQQKQKTLTLPSIVHKGESHPDEKDGAEVEDPELAEIKSHWRSRPVMLYESLLVGFSCILMLFLTSLGYSKLTLIVSSSDLVLITHSNRDFDQRIYSGRQTFEVAFDDCWPIGYPPYGSKSLAAVGRFRVH